MGNGKTERPKQEVKPENDSVRYPRGSVPLIISLGEAFDIAGKLYEQAGGIASTDLLSQLLGNSASSSSFVKKVNALRTYGLIEQSGAEYLLTDIGGAIAAPQSPQSKATAKKESFLRVDVFARVFERHKGKLLPADEFLKNIIEQDCKIPKELSSDWVKYFKAAAQSADLLFTRADGKVKIMDSLIVRFPRTDTSVSAEMKEQFVEVEPSPSKTSNGMTPSMTGVQTETGHNTKIELSGRRYASFFIPDRLTPKDAQKLKSALKGFEAIIDSMMSDETEGI